MNKIFLNNIGDLGEAQRASYYRFLSKGISEELITFPNPFRKRIKLPTRNKATSCLIYLYTNEIKFKGPVYDVAESLALDRTYAIPFYIRGEYSYPFNKTLDIMGAGGLVNENSSLSKRKIKNILIKQYIFLGELPLMTDEGTFIINGCERVVVSQIIRSPGIYFRKEFGTSRKATFTATIISNKGFWTKFILSEKIVRIDKDLKFNLGDQIYIKLNNLKENKEDSDSDKLFISELIGPLGLLSEDIKYPFILEKYHYLKEKTRKDLTNAFNLKIQGMQGLPRTCRRLTKNYNCFLKEHPKFLDINDRLLVKKFLSSQCESAFSIGELGRYRVNKKLGLIIPKDVTYLTVQDFIGIFNGLIELKYFDRISDEIDHIKNKQIRSIGELLQSQIRTGFYRLQKSIIEESIIEERIIEESRLQKSRLQKSIFDENIMDENIMDENIFDENIFDESMLDESIMDESIMDESMLDESIMDESMLDENIIDESMLDENIIDDVRPENVEIQSDRGYWILDPRYVTSVIKEFFITSQLSQYMDQINPLAELTHKRRVSVFGPNGLKRDHISTVIRDIHPSQYGRLCPIETPEGQNAGLITSISLLGRISALGWIEAPYFYMENSSIYSNKETIFLNPEQEAETVVAFADISLTKDNSIVEKYLSVKKNDSFLSAKKLSINFITTSPLQIISIATALIPFIEHDDANRALMGSNMQRQAVPLLYPQKPIIGTGLEIAAILDSGMVIKAYSEGSVIESSCNSITIEDLQQQQIKYNLRKHSRSNQETSMNQRPIVWVGEKAFSGQIIADGPSTSDGELSLGRNLTIAYMPWEGYNYEDAIIINERVVYEDCLTSIHIEEYETSLNYTALGDEILTRNLPYQTNYIRRHLDKQGIVRIGSYVKEHDILVGKLTPCEAETSAEAKLLRAIYGKKKPPFRDTSLCAGTEGRVIDARIISTNIFSEDEEYNTLLFTIRVFIAQVRKIQIGDKLAGRHGNKGIISRVLSKQDMPYLPDGTPVDIILNPLGVPSRMNVGQIFEGLLGLAGEKLGNRFKVSPFDEIYGLEASRVFVNQKLKEAALKTNENWIFNKYFPGKMLLRDGRTGEYFDNPITIGRSYILKLIHLVEDKIHARATGPYAMITEQPLAGKSQKGGQRFGEMEVWALEAYGCSNTLQELLTIKSDDIDGRNDMYESILAHRDIEKPTPSIPESFLALIGELHALGLEFYAKRINGGFYSTEKISSVEKDIFKVIEGRLKLRNLLARKKSEYYANPYANTELFIEGEI